MHEQTRVTTAERFRTASQATPTFTINFGERVVELDPTRLFAITGTNRSDIAYDVSSGRIIITAYVLDPMVSTTIR